MKSTPKQRKIWRERAVAYRAQYPKRAAESLRKSSKKRYEERRAWLMEQKDRPCVDCKGTYPSYVMHFDHVRGQKLFNIGSAIGNYSFASLAREIAKCDVVCANCHAERTWGRKKQSQ